MESRKIDKDEHRLEQLLVGNDPRQVHTRHRETDDVVYLEEDSEKGDYAEAELACIKPDCNVPIYLAQGTVRLHYKHYPNTAKHDDAELELYAISYALRDWARASGFPETSFKDHRTGTEITIPIGSDSKATHRVVSRRLETGEVDVLSPPHQWFVWGGLIRRAKGSPSRVRLPRFVMTLLQHKQSVLVIVPEQRVVGTLTRVNEPDFRPTGGVDQCELELCSLEECTIDEGGRVVTPAMLRQDGAQTQARRKAELHTRDLQARSVKSASPVLKRRPVVWPLVREAGTTARAPQIQRKPAPPHWDAERSWEASWAFETAHSKYGEILPNWLTEGVDAEWALDVLPVHWHAEIYFKDLHNARRPVSAEYVARHLSVREWPEEAANQLAKSNLVTSYLDRLVQVGEVRQTGDGKYELASRGSRRQSR